MGKLKIVSILILLAAALGGVLYFVKVPVQVGNTPTPSASPTPSAQTEIETYSSSALGISFQYNPHPAEQVSIGIKEEGNRIYVYPDYMQPEIGQFVEVFNKDANETFEASIKRQILAKFPSSKCKIETESATSYPAGFVSARITYPLPDNSEEVPWKNAKLCNEKYAMTNGNRYFLYDPSHPDKFLYFDIGQYAISAGENISWQDTVRFVSQ